MASGADILALGRRIARFAEMRDVESPLTQERLKQLLRYDSETGVFTWRISPAKQIKPGTVAGTPKGNGYQQIKVDERVYLAHRLAWLYVHGTWPSSKLDHRDTDRSNNRLSNLRLASNSQNSANSRRRKTANPNGLKGVCFHEGRALPYQARIVKNYQRIHIGYFATQEEAHDAYLGKARELFGEFARAA